jgi:hypothetical protein
MPEIVGRLRTPRLASAPSSPQVGEAYYNTTDNTLYWWNGTAWISASGSGADLVYNGAFPANTPYTDGDVVIYNGMAYLCVRPTSATPVPWTGISGPSGPPGPQGPQGAAGVAGAQGAGVPTPVVNGTWLKGVGGAALWTSLQATDVPGLVAADTAWHYVGSAGEPAFQNGFYNYGGQFVTTRFRKLATGLVVLDGLIGGGTSGTVAFTLPVGYRPDMYRHIGGWGTEVIAGIRINTDGTVQLNGTPGYFTLSGISFYP